MPRPVLESKASSAKAKDHQILEVLCFILAFQLFQPGASLLIGKRKYISNKYFTPVYDYVLLTSGLFDQRLKT